MSSLRQDGLRAVFAGDIHTSAVAPVARSAEPDWRKAMARQFDQLAGLMDDNPGVPLFYCGDVFDTWRVKPELINWAIRHLPHGYGIPGNHDLPYHNYEDVKASPYWTLVEAGVIEDMKPGETKAIRDLTVTAFPWGYEPAPLKKPNALVTNVALVHRYLWIDGHNPARHSDEYRLRQLKDQLRGYDVAVFADNHSPFEAGLKYKSGHRITVANCGGFFRRRSDEVQHRPSVVLLFGDGEIDRHYFDCRLDKFLDPTDLEKLVDAAVEHTLADFIEELNALGDKALDFKAAVRKWLLDNAVKKGVSKFILEAIEGRS